MEGRIITERACLTIADISGYTSYLSGVELDHAQDVLADLLVAVATPLRPTFQVAKLEGDAIFLYSPIEAVDGSVLLDLVESCYFSFRRRLLSIQQASTCRCDACRLIPSLDLKVVIHHGSVVRHEVLGSQELIGQDVIVVHRLLKNRIVDELGMNAYALLTDACIAATALDAEHLDMVRYEEAYDDIGDVRGWVHDLQRAWEQEQARQSVRVEPDEAQWTSEAHAPGIPVSLAWEWLTAPACKIEWEVGFDDIFETPADGGRRGVGTQTHCLHGGDTINMEVLDWRPPWYVTNAGSFPNGVPFVVTDEVISVDDGVLLRKSMRSPTPETREALDQVLGMVSPMLDQWLPTLTSLLPDVLASLRVDAEPELPRPDEATRLATAMSD